MRCTGPRLAPSYVQMDSVLARLHVASMSIPQYLLASDLDGTLIPLERSAKRLRELREFVHAVRDAEGLLLAYVTGRHLALAQRGIEEFELPLPDLLVCDVGTSVYRVTDGVYAPDEEYRKEMRTAFGGLRGEDVKSALDGIESLKLQEDEKQAEFKVSYYTPKNVDSVLNEAADRLKSAGARVNLVASYDSVLERGLLDVLPAGVAKDYAVRYLHDHTKIAAEHLIYAGDSGNDRAAMLAGYRVIVVANAEESLKSDLRKEAAKRRLSGHLYFAHHPFARGVLEGCRHFGVL